MKETEELRNRLIKDLKINPDEVTIVKSEKDIKTKSFIKIFTPGSLEKKENNKN